jgi:hypothetical protein
MAMIIQFPDELVKEFERLNLKVVAHAEGVTLEVQSTLEQDSAVPQQIFRTVVVLPMASIFSTITTAV